MRSEDTGSNQGVKGWSCESDGDDGGAAQRKRTEGGSGALAQEEGHYMDGASVASVRSHGAGLMKPISIIALALLSAIFVAAYMAGKESEG